MHEKDKKWVTEQLNQLPNPTVRQGALLKYREVYDESYESEPIEHKKNNVARREANTRLMRYVKAVIKPNRQNTTKQKRKEQWN